MDLETFLVAVYCLTDDTLPMVLHETRLRQGSYRYVCQHHRALFPALGTVHRPTFLRQAANLWTVKRALWQALVPRARGDAALSILDSVPVPVARFSRAKRCRRFPGVAAEGRDPCLPGLCFGLRAHLRLTGPGVIASFALAPANTADIAVAPELPTHATGWALADRAYGSPVVREQLRASGVALLTPFQTRKYERTPWPRWLVTTRRRVETVLAPLVERYRSKRSWARDLWQLQSRWLRSGAQSRDGRAAGRAARPRFPCLQATRHRL